MSRVATTNLSLGCWDEGDNPGAGSKTVATSNIGLNGNTLIIDAAVGVGHNADGTHKADVIDGPNLKTSCADASTIQLTGTPLKLNLKDDGVTGAKIAAAFADGVTIAASAATGAKTIGVKTASISKAHCASTIADASSIELDGTNGLQVKADGITAAHMAHDNPRLRTPIVFGFVQGEAYGRASYVPCGATFGIPMPDSGFIVAIFLRTSDGNVDSDTQAYSASGNAAAGRFASGDPLSASWGEARVGGTAVTGVSFASVPTIPDGGYGLMTVLVEFDD